MDNHSRLLASQRRYDAGTTLHTTYEPRGGPPSWMYSLRICVFTSYDDRGFDCHTQEQHQKTPYKHARTIYAKRTTVGYPTVVSLAH